MTQTLAVQGLIGGGDVLRLTDGRVGKVRMTKYELFTGKPPSYELESEAGERFEAGQSDIAERLSVGRHMYYKPKPGQARGICQRCLEPKKAHSA